MEHVIMSFGFLPDFLLFPSFPSLSISVVCFPFLSFSSFPFSPFLSFPVHPSCTNPSLSSPSWLVFLGECCEWILAGRLQTALVRASELRPKDHDHENKNENDKENDNEEREIRDRQTGKQRARRGWIDPCGSASNCSCSCRSQGANKIGSKEERAKKAVELRRAESKRSQMHEKAETDRQKCQRQTIFVHAARTHLDKR